MSASSVTGQGKGAALGQKGPGNKRDMFLPLSGPHIVATGTTVAGTTVTVKLNDSLPLPPTSYVVICTPLASTTTLYVTNVQDVNGLVVGGLYQFTINTASSVAVQWMVVQIGQCLDVNASLTQPSGTVPGTGYQFP